MSEKQIDLILEKVDSDKNNRIEYSEFLAHTLTQNHLTKNNVRSFFKAMLPIQPKDVAGNDQGHEVISAIDIQYYMQKCGKQYELTEIEELIAEILLDTNELSFDTFFKFMTSFIQ